MSIDEAERLLGYRPRYTSLQAIAEALHWLQRNHQVDVGHDEFTDSSDDIKQPSQTQLKTDTKTQS
jgi:hypothetical protein